MAEKQAAIVIKRERCVCAICQTEMVVYSTSQPFRESGVTYRRRYWRCPNKCEDSENGKTVEEIRMPGATAMHFDLMDGGF
jgi:hypothetical protein